MLPARVKNQGTNVIRRGNSRKNSDLFSSGDLSSEFRETKHEFPIVVAMIHSNIKRAQ